MTPLKPLGLVIAGVLFGVGLTLGAARYAVDKAIDKMNESGIFDWLGNGPDQDNYDALGGITS